MLNSDTIPVNESGISVVNTYKDEITLKWVACILAFFNNTLLFKTRLNALNLINLKN